MEGWSKNKIKPDNKINTYYKYRDELTVMNNMICKGSSIIIPSSQRKDILNRIHYAHMGYKKFLSLAKEQVFWPTRANQLKQLIERCHLCQKYAKIPSLRTIA